MLARFLLFGALLAAGQANLDIFERLRQAPLPSGQGEAAATALRRHDFPSVERILAGAQPSADNDKAELLSLTGAVEFLAAKMAPAAAAFLAAEKLAPLSDADSFTLAMAEVRLNRHKEATAVLTDLAGKHPRQSLYLYWLGKIDYDQRRYDEAVAKLKQVIELDPHSTRAYDSLGLAYDMQGEFEPARQALARAAELNRNQPHPSPWPPHDYGYLLFRMDRLNEAEDALREALRYDPSFAQAHYHLARLLEKQRQDAAAISEYEQAISLDKSSAEPCYSLALLYRKVKRESDAEKMFTEYKRRKSETPGQRTPSTVPDP